MYKTIIDKSTPVVTDSVKQVAANKATPEELAPNAPQDTPVSKPTTTAKKAPKTKKAEVQTEVQTEVNKVA
jgi:hypothetical protein